MLTQKTLTKGWESTTSETNTGPTTNDESCADEMEVDDDQTIIIAEAAVESAKVALKPIERRLQQPVPLHM